jgi:hypothetical protein
MADKYYVAPGKAVSVSRGMIGEGEEIKASDLKNPISKKDLAGMSENEIAKLKEAQFQKLINSDKGILTTSKPGKKKAAIEMDVRPESDAPKESKGSGVKEIGGGAQKK